jgi:hypothetical protein
VLSLDRLSADELAELARRSPEGRRLPPEHVEQLIERSDGVPLYLEELLRNAVLANARTRTESTIPSALRDLLLARFAAPGVDLQLAQVLATIGHEASFPLVAAVAGLHATQLDLQLAALVDAGIVTVVPGEPVAYRFRHQLLAELAYDTQLQGARRAGHGAVADALLQGPADIPPVAPTVLAHHLEEAGRPAEAVRFLTAAAEAAHGLGANAEVTDLLTRAMGLLEAVEGDERARLEFEVRLVRATNAASIMGFAAPQAVEDFTACQELVASQVGSEGYLDDEDAVGGHERMWSATALWANLLLQGNLDAADKVNRDLVAQLRPGGSLRPYFETGPSYIDFFSGDYQAALSGLEAAERLLPDAPLPVRLTVPSDPRITNKAHLAYVLGVRCRFDEAREVSSRGLAVAEHVDFPVGPFSLCYLLSMRASLEVMAEDLEAVSEWTDQLLVLADRHGFTFWTIVAGFYDAYRDLRAGVAGADQRSSAALMMLQGVGVHVWLPYFHASLAAAHLRAGEVGPATDHIRTGRSIAEATGAHYWSPELTRLEGAAELARGETDAGLALVRGAVDRSVAQGAVLHELWARTTLVEATGDVGDRAAMAALVDQVASGTPRPWLDAAHAALA